MKDGQAEANKAASAPEVKPPDVKVS
jgi:hypothetical protein